MIALTQEKRDDLLAYGIAMIADAKVNGNKIYLPDKLIQLMEIALESLTAEPVAYMTYKGYLLHAADPKVSEYSDPEPLYDAPPVPEIKFPEEVEISSLVSPACDKWHQADGWNMCLAEIKRLNGLGE